MKLKLTLLLINLFFISSINALTITIENKDTMRVIAGIDNLEGHGVEILPGKTATMTLQHIGTMRFNFIFINQIGSTQGTTEVRKVQKIENRNYTIRITDTNTIDFI